MKNKYLNKFLKKENEENKDTFDSQLIKIDYKTKREINQANNKKRSKKNNPDHSLIN